MSVERIFVQIDCTVNSATDALLAIEAFAERVYVDRRADAAMQARFNDLADIVLPLRKARDEAIAAEVGSPSP